MAKNLSAMRETWVQSLGWEGPWRRAWQPTPVLFPGESPWTEEPGGLQLMGSHRVGHDWATKHSTSVRGRTGSRPKNPPDLNPERFRAAVWEGKLAETWLVQVVNALPTLSSTGPHVTTDLIRDALELLDPDKPWFVRNRICFHADPAISSHHVQHIRMNLFFFFHQLHYVEGWSVLLHRCGCFNWDLYNMPEAYYAGDTKKSISCLKYV